MSYKLALQWIAVISSCIYQSEAAIPVILDPDPSETTAISVPEDTGGDIDIYSVNATDADGDPLTYTVTAGTKFTINNAGVLRTVTIASFDYEDENDRSHKIAIQVSDGSNNVNVEMTINITDVNDNSPQFYPQSYAVTVEENTPAGTSLLELNCTDNDSEENGNCTVIIQSGDNDPANFNVVGKVLYTTAVLIDYEKNNNFDLRLTGQDNPVNGSPKMATASVTVTVTGVNEQTPTFTDNPTLYISENAGVPFLVARYTATDTDLFPHAIIQYAIQTVTNHGQDVFGIFSITGIILLASSLDFENITDYEITVVSTDGGGLQGTGTVTVSVTDINDNTPICSPMSHHIFVSKTQGSSVVVPDLKCTDLDSGLNSQLNYTIISNPDNLFYFTQNGNSVSVMITESTNLEEGSTYNITVEVTDNGSPTSLSTTVTIQVNITAGSSSNETSTSTTDVPWIQTTAGIAVTATCSVIAVTILIGGSVFAMKHWSQNRAIGTQRRQIQKTDAKDKIDETFQSESTVEKRNEIIAVNTQESTKTGQSVAKIINNSNS